jgi:hypothetical protein
MNNSNVMIQKRSAFMVKWHLGKRKWSLVIAVAIIAVLAVVLALEINQELINKHMYPQDAIHQNSNLSVRGVVTSIEENHKSYGLGSYHIFRLYIQLNITEIVWIREDLAWIVSSTENNTINDRNSNGIGYDNLDNPQLLIGQIVECKGYYLSVTDTPYSFQITVAPSISESYLEPQV